MMKKLYSIIVVFTLLVVMALPYKVEAKQAFSDVPVTHANYADIMYLLEKGVIQESSKYGVTDIVTREEVAVMVAKAVGLDGATSTDTKFSDVKKSNKNSGYIQAAVNAGIVNGYGDNTFKPNQKVTRGHMAAFIARAFDLPAGNKTFKDVPTNHTAYEAVKKLAAANITTGYGDGTFKPENSLTRAHISAFLSRAMKFVDGELTPIPSTPVVSNMEFTIKDAFTNTEEQIQTFLNAYFKAFANRDWGQNYDFWNGGKYRDWNSYAKRTTNKAEIEKLISEDRADFILSRKKEEAKYENAEFSGGFELLEVLYNDKSCVSEIDTPDCLTLLVRLKATVTIDGKIVEETDSLAHAYIAKVSKDINDYGYIIEDDMDILETE